MVARELTSSAPVPVSLQVGVLEFLCGQGGLHRRGDLNGFAAREKERNDIVLGAGRRQLAILDANEGTVHGAADCLSFLAFLRAEGVAELPLLRSEIEGGSSRCVLADLP